MQRIIKYNEQSTDFFNDLDITLTSKLAQKCLYFDFRSPPKEELSPQTTSERVEGPSFRPIVLYYDLLPKILINRHGVPTLNAVSQEATESSVERQTSINVRTRVFVVDARKSCL
ncbi:hypothetical protein K0M31_000013 [Melipona bicolor]|uniref:Uncharacterized protein n=1 Tax=Melipona bicolor TaxID=60889 RepID=A0AA40GE01_9HYME|nr:hypothetical protein K0M31_000013 [Melipona bicolor]